MRNGKKDRLYSLIPFEAAKTILGPYDKEDDFFRLCLFRSTRAIEQFCDRRLVRRRHCHYYVFPEDYIYPLHEYPVRKIHSVYATWDPDLVKGKKLYGEESFVACNNYYCLPEEGADEDRPHIMVLRPPLRNSLDEIKFRVNYTAGYDSENMPDILLLSFLNVVSWNFKRNMGRYVRGEQLEVSLPENVQFLLQPYRRVLI